MNMKKEKALVKAKKKNEGTVYVAHWTHSIDNCPLRSKEGGRLLSKLLANRAASAKMGIKIIASYITVTEHDLYIIVQANDYASVVEFFLPLVPTQTGSFKPVLPIEEWTRIWARINRSK